MCCWLWVMLFGGFHLGGGENACGVALERAFQFKREGVLTVRDFTVGESCLLQPNMGELV